jgi:hypothetical protein
MGLKLIFPINKSNIVTEDVSIAASTAIDAK